MTIDFLELREKICDTLDSLLQMLKEFINPFRYLLSTSCILGAMLNAGHSVVNKLIALP